MKPHPLKRLLPKGPAWQKGGEAFDALVESVRACGIETPLLVDDKNFILDGEVRWEAARQLRLPAVPTLPAVGDPATVILNTLLRRQHLTKSALAFLAFPLLKQALEEAKGRRLENLRKGQCFSVVDPINNGSKTLQDLAASLGIERTTLWHAEKVHAIFERDHEYRDLMLPRILGQPIGGEHEDQRPVGLGAVIAGYAGRKNKDAERPDRGQLELFKDVINRGFNRISYWQKLKTDPAIWELVDEKAAASQPDELEALVDFHSAMASRLRRALKEGMTA